MSFAGAHTQHKSGNRAFIMSLLVWNPLVAGALTYAISGAFAFGLNWLVAVVVCDVVALLCFLGVDAFIRIERWLARLHARPEPHHSIEFYFLIAIGLMPLALFLGLFVGAALAHQLGLRWGGPNSRAYRMGLGFGVVITALFFFQQARAKAREAVRQAESRIAELEKLRLEAQLAALTSEMNPHLLFNALNTVASLVHSSPDRAEEVVVQLAELYRGLLRSARSARHSLQDELTICESYLKVEQARFGDRLVVEFEVAPSVDPEQVTVPVLFLQPFVENAIKHGFSSRSGQGLVRIELALRQQAGSESHRPTQLLCAAVEDDGVGFGQSDAMGSGKAIDNCRQRLTLNYGDDAGVTIGAREGGGTRVEVWFPREKGAADDSSADRR